MTYLLLVAAACGVSLWFASRRNRITKIRHDSIVSWRRDLELLSDADVERADELVREYAAVLERQRLLAPRLRRASDLPASKEQIAAAVFTLARFARLKDPSPSHMLETLAADYSRLGEFVAGDEADQKLADQASVLARIAVECERRKEEFSAFLDDLPGGPASATS